jgi:hypothetical protein
MQSVFGVLGRVKRMISRYAPFLWDHGLRFNADFQLQDLVAYDTEKFRSREFALPRTGASTTRTAQEERDGKNAKLRSDYLINVVPSLGISSDSQPMAAVGTNE